VLDEIVAADNAGDLEAVVRIYSDDALLLPPEGEPIAGREAIHAHYARIFETDVLEVPLSSEETVVSGDLAFNRGRTSVRATPRAGGDARETSDKYLMILRRNSDGKWKIARLIWNRSGTGDTSKE
jgi:uncharacterized protein (TIGR02246 family)